MTPFYMNSPPSPFPFIELKEDHQKIHFFSTTPNQASSSLSSPIFFNITQDQRATHPREPQKDNRYILHSGSSDHQVAQSSFVRPTIESTKDGDGLSIGKLDGDIHEGKRDHDQSPIWIPSKMRLMQKMMNNGSDHKQERVIKINFHDQEIDKCGTNSPNNGGNIVRICSDCKTTKTPLWRSGPQGPKSLCNACGIRQRKARRAMLAANGTVNLATDNSKIRTHYKVQKKEKKTHTSYNMAQNKKPFVPPQPQGGEIRNVSFEDFAMMSLSKSSGFQQAFPKDEEEAAILLMALSCGLLHS